MTRRIGKIEVIGLGPGTLEEISLGTYKKIKKHQAQYARTSHHPVVAELEAEGVVFQSFDSLYTKHAKFQAVYEDIVETLISEAADSEVEIGYAVPGHPLVAEETVQQLLQAEKQGRVRISISGGQSFLDPVFRALRIDPNDGLQMMDATAFDGRNWSLTDHLIVTQLYDTFTASEVKLSLMEQLPGEYEVTLVRSAGMRDEDVRTMPLYMLDREIATSNLTVLYVPPVPDDAYLMHTFFHLRDVIKTLRGPGGCPWDQKQTHKSLKKFLLEESYEVFDAIDEEDEEHLEEELGDVLLQVMLHAQIGEDEGYFNIDDVIRKLAEKMIRRHPHVFTDDPQLPVGADEMEKRWEQIKQAEKEGAPSSFLDGIPASMPSLMTAYELQKKAAKAGFQWEEAAPMWEKLEEEIAEAKEALEDGGQEASKKEFGDVFFVLVNLARHFKIQPEEALHMTNRKFQTRFRYIEKRLQEAGTTVHEASLEEMDEYWDEAKERERLGRHEIEE